VPYRLTQGALEDIRRIYAYSVDRWGEAQARTYIGSLYKTLDGLSREPDRDISRRKRSHPFQMIASGMHFIIYETMAATVIVHALPHQSRDIERYIRKSSSRFRKALAEIKRGN